MSTYEEHLATRPRAAVYDRWATRLTWMIIPALVAAAYAFFMLSTWTGSSVGFNELWAAVGLVCSTVLACSLLAARLVLAALRDAELDA